MPLYILDLPYMPFMAIVTPLPPPSVTLLLPTLVLVDTYTGFYGFLTTRTRITHTTRYAHTRPFTTARLAFTYTTLVPHALRGPTPPVPSTPPPHTAPLHHIYTHCGYASHPTYILGLHDI